MPTAFGAYGKAAVTDRRRIDQSWWFKLEGRNNGQARWSIALGAKDRQFAVFLDIGPPHLPQLLDAILAELLE